MRLALGTCPSGVLHSRFHLASIADPLFSGNQSQYVLMGKIFRVVAHLQDEIQIQ